MDNDNPFEGIPFFGDFEKLFGGGGQDHWSTAKQIAVQMAAGEDGDANVDPSHRIALEELSRVAQLHVCLLYTSPSPRDVEESRMPSSA